MYSLMKWKDRLAEGATVTPSTPAQHMMVYVASGTATINGVEVPEGSAYYCEDFFAAAAGPKGAELWRWGIARDGAGLGLLDGIGVTSLLRMRRTVKMFELVPTSKWLFRLDCIVEFEGTTGLHSHPGSGIRCLLDGQLRTESEKGEDTNNQTRGDVWYEEGAYPLVSTVDEGRKATFLRGMILPPEYLTYGETGTWIEGIKAKYSVWRPLGQKVVTLR